MYLAYKNDNFMVKVMAVVFIVVYLIMCLFGTSVYAGYNLNYTGVYERDYIFNNIPDDYYYFIENSSNSSVGQNESLVIYLSESPLYFSFNQEYDNGTIGYYLTSDSENIYCFRFGQSDYKTVKSLANSCNIENVINGNASSSYFSVRSNTEKFYHIYDNSNNPNYTPGAYSYGYYSNIQNSSGSDIDPLSLIKSSERGTEDNPGGSGNTGNTGEPSGGDTGDNPSDTDNSGILSGIKGSLKLVVDSLKAVLDLLTNPALFFADIIKLFGDIISYINPVGENFILKDIISALNPVSENFILKSVIDFFGNILSYLNPVSENFILKDVKDFLGNLLSYLNPVSDNFFGKKLIELLQSLFELLFIPSEEHFTAITNTVKSKFDFIDSIKYSIQSVENILTNLGQAPKLEINLNHKYLSGNVVVLDLSWYAPYKTYGDLIITGFVYLMFLWRLFCHVPDILNGSGSLSDGIDAFSVFDEFASGKHTNTYANGRHSYESGR